MTENTQVILLLTARFTPQGGNEPVPLAPKEWGRIAALLREKGLEPAAFFHQDLAVILADWRDPKVTPGRLNLLLDRAAAMGLALEKWQRAGLWVMTYYDAEYPQRFTERLGDDRPALIFGCGNRNLLQQRGIAVVGSRDATIDDMAYSSHLGRHIALNGLSVISGGARGVDEYAMIGALKEEGAVVGILADSLLNAATSNKYREFVMRNDMTLISTCYPEAKFEVGNAMARNRYIYCLSDAAIVITASEGKGGTWNGACEDLKHGWVPLWVKADDDLASGNAVLVKKGARWLPEGKFDVEELTSSPVEKNTIQSLGLFDDPYATQPQAITIAEARAKTAADSQQKQPDTTEKDRLVGESPREPGSESPQENTASLSNLTFYDMFLLHFEQVTQDDMLSIEELCEQLEIIKPQLTAWLKRAEKEGKVQKTGKPVRYQWRKSLF